MKQMPKGACDRGVCFMGRSVWLGRRRTRRTANAKRRPGYGALWYFPMMTTEPPPPALRAAAAAPATATSRSVAPLPSLAVRHARALYRPVPPVGYDDEGHPESDSAAVESVTHEDVRAYAVRALRIRFAARPGFFAASDLGLLFERGNPAAVMAPDLLVSFRAGHRRRPSYKLWQEPVPDLVLELLSPNTWRRDVEAKPGLYEALGVREFWLFDPIGRLPRPVNGWRLDAGGTYAPVPALPDGGCRSAVLGLDLVPRGRRLPVPRSGDRPAPAGPQGDRGGTGPGGIGPAGGGAGTGPGGVGPAGGGDGSAPGGFGPAGGRGACGGAGGLAAPVGNRMDMGTSGSAANPSMRCARSWRTPRCDARSNPRPGNVATRRSGGDGTGGPADRVCGPSGAKAGPEQRGRQRLGRPVARWVWPTVAVVAGLAVADDEGRGAPASSWTLEATPEQVMAVETSLRAKTVLDDRATLREPPPRLLSSAERRVLDIALDPLHAPRAPSDECDDSAFATKKGDALVEHIRTTPFDCITPLFSESPSRFAAFQKQNMIHVAKATVPLAVAYDGTNSDNIAELFLFLRIGFYVEFFDGGLDWTEPDDGVAAAVADALDAFKDNAHFYDETGEHFRACRPSRVRHRRHDPRAGSRTGRFSTRRVRFSKHRNGTSIGA